MPMSLSREAGAKLACAYAGVVFGVYWIPLRAFEAAGLPGLWATVALSAASFIAILPFLVRRRASFTAFGARRHAVCLIISVGYLCYTGAFLFTTVVNVIVFFYLMPIWGFVLARIAIGERITVVRWLSIAVGIGGVYAIVGGDGGLPIPKAAGDWMALAAGFLWALGSLMILLDKNVKAVDYGIGFIFWSVLLAVAVAWSLSAMAVIPEPAPHFDTTVWIWLVAFGLMVVLPANLATIYGPTILNPGIVGLFFMTEVSVGSITAALMAGEAFGARQIAGVIAITLAGTLEPLVAAVARRL